MPSDSVEAITDLLHRAYRRNSEAGLRFLATHQPPSVTADRLASGLSFVAEVEATLAGVITLRTQIDRPYGDYDPPYTIASFGQFGVDSRFRGLGVGDALLATVERAASEAGCVELALDTAQPSTRLVAYYEGRSFRIVGRADWRPLTNYESWIMTKSL